MTDLHVREFNCRSCGCHVRWRAAATATNAVEADAVAKVGLCRFCEVASFTAGIKPRTTAARQHRHHVLTFPPAPVTIHFRPSR